MGILASPPQRPQHAPARTHLRPDTLLLLLGRPACPLGSAALRYLPWGRISSQPVLQRLDAPQRLTVGLLATAGAAVAMTDRGVIDGELPPAEPTGVVALVALVLP